MLSYRWRGRNTNPRGCEERWKLFQTIPCDHQNDSAFKWAAVPLLQAVSLTVEGRAHQSYLSRICPDKTDVLLCDTIFLYAFESWTLTAELQRIQAMEMRCYHKILHTSYKDHVTKEEVHAKIQQTIRPHEDLAIIKKHKLKWYGHISCSLGLAKTVLQGTVKGWRRLGKQKRWEDIREWTGLKFTNL